MPTKQQLLKLVRAGRSYEEIGRLHGIHPGQAYMIVTGFPADGSTTVGPEPEIVGDVEGLLPGSTQHLANPPSETPQRDEAVLEWLKKRAASDPGMEQAASSHSAEPLPLEGEGDAEGIVSLICWDHNELKHLLKELEAVPGSRKGGHPDQQRKRASIVDMIRVRLVEHETLEEKYLWPVVRERLPDGGRFAQEGLSQEQEGTDHLQAMMSKDSAGEEFDKLVEKLVVWLRKHVAFEDRVLLELKQELPDDLRNEIGRAFVSGKRSASTRLHANAPDHPTAGPTTGKVTSPIVAPIDKARDVVENWLAQPKSRVKPALGAEQTETHTESEDL